MRKKLLCTIVLSLVIVIMLGMFPSQAYSTSLSPNGYPGSVNYLYENGALKQIGMYGSNWLPLFDIDFAHGGVGHIFPHYHLWTPTRSPGYPL